ncbi:retrovirus-related pol polyprotein from transposon TNT 1-94 [Tanacetum coccineum]
MVNPTLFEVDRTSTQHILESLNSSLALPVSLWMVSRVVPIISIVSDVLRKADTILYASSSANKKPEYVKSEEKKEDKKVDEKKRDMSKVKCYNCKKEGHFAKDCKKAKDKAWDGVCKKNYVSDSDQEINANMVFMAKMENVFSDSEESSSSAKETIAEWNSA